MDPTPYESPSMPGFPSLISDRPIDQVRPLKAIYVGAGISGIVAAIEFLKTVPKLELVIYEKNPEIGGTWYENRYPGCACDIPSHAYQLSFESSTQWSQFYAGSAEILAYWQQVADKYQVQRHIKFNHKCVEARWDGELSKWLVKLLRTDLETPQVIEDTADVLFTGTGLLNEWCWPSIPGLQSFKGKLLHTADWDNSFDVKGKRVAVIGAGSSGIQVVPALVDQVATIDHYVRGKTWICPQISEDVLRANSAAGSSNFNYTDAHKDKWNKDPEAYLKYRKMLESQLQGFWEATKTTSVKQSDARVTYEKGMRDRLDGRADLLEALLPEYPPLCKRITPGPGYLEALRAPHVSTITSAIVSVNDTGITTEDGVHRPIDVIICATGFQTGAGAGFPIYGQNGVNLRTRQAFRPETYLGLCTDGFPSFFQSLGPNTWQGAGSLLITIEHAHRYFAKILRKMMYENVKTIQPKRKQVENFTNFCEEYFKTTVYTSPCVSWYKTVDSRLNLEDKKRERVTALWPGSSLHALNVMKEVRWEDFNMEYVDGNDFGWFGNGSVMVDTDAAANVEARTWYVEKCQFLHDPLEITAPAKAPERNFPVTEDVTQIDSLRKSMPTVTVCSVSEVVT